MQKQIAKAASCYLCHGLELLERPGRVRDDAALKIWECTRCGLVFLSSKQHIDQEFYAESGMHHEDVDLAAWRKDTLADDLRRFNYLKSEIAERDVLDVGCGNGGFLLNARQIAGHAEGVEPEKKWHAYFKDEGLTIYPDLNCTGKKYDVITLFHVLEHIAEPTVFLQNLTAQLKPNGQLFIEVPNANDALLNLYQNDAFRNFTYWSCHLFLYTNHTLALLGEKAGLKLNYLKQIQRYPLSNHLHWLAKGKPGGHQVWNFLDSPELHNAYEKQLAAIGGCDTIIASFSRD